MIEYFWLLLTIGCVVWYMVVLGYVAYRGAGDIRSMLRQIASQQSPENPVAADSNVQRGDQTG
ncbi:MAG: hypothetical protein JXB10_06020 [Pirellulales bacterium]|nr:hypothetical protein [Pirellulales bacterium]